jgi:hypothetical protein
LVPLIRFERTSSITTTNLGGWADTGAKFNLNCRVRAANSFAYIAMRAKRSIIWILESETVRNVVALSNSYSEILDRLGLKIDSGGNFKTLKARIAADNINCQHIIEANKKRMIRKEIPLEKILVNGIKYKNPRLKTRLVAGGILEDRCSTCGIGNNWNGKPLVLQLDHINGNSYDNRLENLRIICPNCHTQTSTYAGRNQQKKNPDPRKICECGNRKSKKAKFCMSCRIRPPTKTKIIWPLPEELQKMLWEKPTSQLAKELGVSDSIIGKHAKKFGLSKPSRGYWRKLECNKV